MSSRVISRAAALACVALVASACAGEATPAPTSQLVSTTTTGVDGALDTAPAAQTAPPTSDASPTERPAPDSERPIAPDFSLDLADGSTFVLSQETRPVFMVFWAEW